MHAGGPQAIDVRALDDAPRDKLRPDMLLAIPSPSLPHPLSISLSLSALPPQQKGVGASGLKRAAQERLSILALHPLSCVWLDWCASVSTQLLSFPAEHSLHVLRRP
jgi:hypothetical protein